MKSSLFTFLFSLFIFNFAQAQRVDLPCQGASVVLPKSVQLNRSDEKTFLHISVANVKNVKLVFFNRWGQRLFTWDEAVGYSGQEESQKGPHQLSLSVEDNLPLPQTDRTPMTLVCAIEAICLDGKRLNFSSQLIIIP